MVGHQGGLHRAHTPTVDTSRSWESRKDETLNWKNRTEDIPFDRWDRYASVQGMSQGRWPIWRRPYQRDEETIASYEWPKPYPIGYDAAYPYTAWQETYETNPTCTQHTNCTNLLVSSSKDDCQRCVYINGGEYECANTLCNLKFV